MPVDKDRIADQFQHILDMLSFFRLKPFSRVDYLKKAEEAAKAGMELAGKETE